MKAVTRRVDASGCLPPEFRLEQRAMTTQSWIGALEREAELALNRGEARRGPAGS